MKHLVLLPLALFLVSNRSAATGTQQNTELVVQAYKAQIELLCDEDYLGGHNAKTCQAAGFRYLAETPPGEPVSMNRLSQFACLSIQTNSWTKAAWYLQKVCYEKAGLRYPNR